MDTAEQETFEPSREQMAHVERLSIEFGSVEVSLDGERKLVTVKTDPGAYSTRRRFTFDESGEDVTARIAGVPTEARLSLPVILVARLIGDGPTALAVEGVAGMEMPAFRLGEVVADSVIAEIERLIAAREA